MAFDYLNGQAFMRDGFVPFKDANVSIASSPVLYGLSIYTVFSVNRNETTDKLYAFRLRDHYARLVNSAKIMDMNMFALSWPYERFEKTMIELVRKNNIQENVLVRATVFVDALIAGQKFMIFPCSRGVCLSDGGDPAALGDQYLRFELDADER